MKTTMFAALALALPATVRQLPAAPVPRAPSDTPLVRQVSSRKLLQMTPGQAANLQNLQQQAAVAQQQQQQAALQLANAQAQAAEASEQLAGEANQLASVNTAQQSNVAELSVLLPPQGAPGPAPQSAAGTQGERPSVVPT